MSSLCNLKFISIKIWSLLQRKKKLEGRDEIFRSPEWPIFMTLSKHQDQC